MTLTTVRAMLETAASVGIGVSTVGGILLWMFREKLGKWVVHRVQEAAEVGVWVDARIDQRTAALRAEHDELEDRMSEQEKTSTLVAQSLQHLTEGFNRVTQVLERVEIKAGQTAEVVARIEGTIERRSRSRE